MTGFKESELVAMCRRVDPNIIVPFRVHECTGYHDKNRPTWQQMEKLAIHVSPGTLKPVGFKVGAGFGETTVRVAVSDDDDSNDNDDE